MNQKRGEVDLLAQLHKQVEVASEILLREGLLLPDRPVVLETLKFRLPQREGAEWLAILTGSAEDGTPQVAFMGGDTFGAVFVRAMRQYEDGTLRWKIDEYRIRKSGAGSAGGEK